MSWAQEVRRLVPIFTCCQGNMEVPAGACFMCWYTEQFHRTLSLKRSELEVGGVPIAFKSSLGASNSGMFSTPPYLSSLTLSETTFHSMKFSSSFAHFHSPPLCPLNSRPAPHPAVVEWSGMLSALFFFQGRELLMSSKNFQKFGPNN